MYEKDLLTVRSRRILFVGPAKFYSSVRGRLEQKDYAVRRAGDFESVVDLLNGSKVDLVIFDLDGARNRLEVIRQVRSIPTLAKTRVLAVGRWGTGQATMALSAGANAYEPTPGDANRLADAVDRILNRRATVVGMNR